jgi:Na+/H+ antiporter NhaC
MKAISPLIFFIITYLATSIVARDFYKVPITVAFMLTAIFSIAVSKGRLNNRIKTFNRGAGRKSLMLMLWIFILAGAFANSAKEMGCVEAFVNLTLYIVPHDALLSGLFLASALLSLSIGTSVGTIVALTPIAVGIAEATGTSTPMLTAIVVGGSFFGDNLSFISDTTVVATQSQGCSMSDKFKTNIYIALPAAVVVIFIYALIGSEVTVPPTPDTNEFIKVIPYLAVLIVAIMGVNVFIVLTIGILLTGLLNIVMPTPDELPLYTWFGTMGDGIAGMGELIIVSLLAGGILEVIRANGGIRYIINKILRHVNNPMKAEFSIAALVSLVDVCTANNTIAIITVSGIAREISGKFHLDPRRVASILDTFSCIMQGFIPYGAQLLMAAALAQCNPASIIPYLYYTYSLLFAALLAITFRFPKKIVDN